MGLKIQSVVYPTKNYNFLSEEEQIKLFGEGILSAREKIKKDYLKHKKELKKRFNKN